MIWFALPIDIALMILKQNETGQDSYYDINTIPFIPDDAKVNFDRKKLKNYFLFILRHELSV